MNRRHVRIRFIGSTRTYAHERHAVIFSRQVYPVMPMRMQNPLDDSQLGSRNVKRVNVSRQPRESLLCAVRSDKSVDLDGRHVVLLLKCSGDLALVGLDVDDEDERVVLLNLLHGGLGVEWVDEDPGGIEARLVGNRLAGVLGCAAGSCQFPSSIHGAGVPACRPRWACADGGRETYESSRVLGRWKLVLLRTLRTLCELTFTSR